MNEKRNNAEPHKANSSFWINTTISASHSRRKHCLTKKKKKKNLKNLTKTPKQKNSMKQRLPTLKTKLIQWFNGFTNITKDMFMRRKGYTEIFF